MVYPSTIAAILAFTSTALAGPHSTHLTKRDPANFRLYEVHMTQNSCIPGACIPAVNSYTINVHDDCNGGSCNTSPSRDIVWRESYCDVDFKVCDRTLQMRAFLGSSDCRPLGDLVTEGADGQGYARLWEGNAEIGSCAVDFSQHKSSSCGALGGGVEFQSHVLCTFY